MIWPRTSEVPSLYDSSLVLLKLRSVQVSFFSRRNGILHLNKVPEYPGGSASTDGVKYLAVPSRMALL